MISKDSLHLNQANFFAFNRALAIPGVGEVYESRSLKWVYTGLPSNNRVYSRSVNPKQVRAVAKRFAEWDVPLAWIVGSDADELQSEKVLRRYGFKRLDRWTGMSLKLSEMGTPPPPPKNSRLERVSPRTLPVWAQTIGKATRMTKAQTGVFTQLFSPPNPALRHFLVRLEERPVTTFSLFEGQGALGIYYVTTIPEARGQGLATAYLWQLLALEDRAQIAVLQATQAGFGVYKRIGFSPDGYFDVYLRRSGG